MQKFILLVVLSVSAATTFAQIPVTDSMATQQRCSELLKTHRQALETADSQLRTTATKAELVKFDALIKASPTACEALSKLDTTKATQEALNAANEVLKNRAIENK